MADTNLDIRKDTDAQERLEQLGYKQELARVLSPNENIIMSLSNASPVMAAFLFGLAPFFIAGTAAIPAAIIQGIAVILISLVLAELGSIYPVSGGLYSIANYILPKPLVYVATFMFLFQALIFPPSIALGTATYLQILFPMLPQSAFATSIIAVITTLVALVIGLNSIATSNLVTKILMAIQFVVVAIFLIACFANPNRSIIDVLSQPQLLSAGGNLAVPSFGVILMSVGTMFAVVNGYDAALGFSEETKGSCRNVGRTVFITAILISTSVILIFIAAVVAAPDLTSFLSAESPLLYSTEAAMGKTATIIINIGILIASFSGLVVLIVYMSRTIYTAGRDGVFPEGINKSVTKLSKKSQIPWVATTVLAVVTIALSMTGDLVMLITFGGILTATVYLLISLGSVSHRKKYPDMERPFRMPLFPLTPIVTSIGLLIALSSQQPRDIAIGVGFIVLALIYYYFYIRPRDEKKAEKK